MKVSVTLICLFATLISSCSGRPSEEIKDVFIAKKLQLIISDSDTVVEASLLSNMQHLPSVVHTEDAYGHLASRYRKELIGPLKEKLLDMIMTSNTFDPSFRLSECAYEPGAMFQVFSKKEELTFTILLCLNCDVWAITDASSTNPDKISEAKNISKDAITAFSDFKSSRNAVKEFYGELKKFLYANEP